jgi:hypothetical protein
MTDRRDVRGQEGGQGEGVGRDGSGMGTGWEEVEAADEAEPLRE